MLKNIGFIFCILCLWNCKQQPSQSVETSQEFDTIPKQTKTIVVDETDFEPFDISEYLSMKLLIGKSETFKKQKIRKLNILGHETYLINSKGLISNTTNISNNYSTYMYTKSGLLRKIILKQHSPPLKYHSTLFSYKQGKLYQILLSKYEQSPKKKEETIITDISKLRRYENYFKVHKNNENYVINRAKRIIKTFQNDLIFCCGKLMPGKNKLQYYYNENNLIDSLVINSLVSNKKMVFEYEYDIRSEQ